VGYHKTHGLGNDLNYTSFILHKDGEGDEEASKIEVRGEQFHPKHRENRYFKGLNNILPNEEDRKEFLIGCARKLGLVKPDIQLEKSDISIQTNVLAKLGRILGEQKKGSFTSVANGMDPFIEKNIINLIKQPYEAVLIPDDGVRCLLFIIDNEREQYLIDAYDKVRRVLVNFDIEVENTVIDGFITEKNDFYPFDLLIYNGRKVTEDYLYDDQYEETNGRIILLQSLANATVSIKAPNSIAIKKPLGIYGKKTIFKGKVQIQPFVGPIDDTETLIQFVKQNRKQNNDIIFVPQKGNSKYMIWKHFVPNNPIVVQLLKQVETKKDSWYVGLIEKTSDGLLKPYKLLRTPIVLSKIKDDKGHEVIFKKNDFIKLRLNIMANGIINENKPYINPTKVPIEEAKTFEETKIEINLITRSIKEDVFQNAEKWEFAKIEKVFIPDESSRMPLKEKVYKFAGKI
jgi:hypothetical protein